MGTGHKSTSGIFRFLSIALLFLALNACSSSSNAESSQNKAPIKIGISVSLSGDFSADGKYLEQGYQVWAAEINKKGGLLGRQVQLEFLNDNSDPKQVAINYQKLITLDHVDLTFGPYSSLLTKPASLIVNRYHYAFPEGAGDGPSVFTQGLHNIFSVSLSAVNLLQTTALYILSLPADVRPKTAAYATEDDPFAGPQVDFARQMLEKGGIRTVSYQVYPAESTDYAPIAQKMISSAPDVTIFGTFLPDISAFIHILHQQKYNPKLLVATAGPDQVDEFGKTLGKDTEGVFVPNTWWPGLNVDRNSQMIQEYISLFGGTADAVSSDVAQAYSVGEVVEQAVNKTQSIDNTKLIEALHTGVFNSVQGAVQFNEKGENTAGLAYLFQWQKRHLVPVYPEKVATANPVFPKPKWT